MRLIADANIWISYLLVLGSEKTISKVVNFILSTEVTLIFPLETEVELRRSIVQKSYLSSRIPLEKAEQLLQRLNLMAEVPPPLELPHTAYVSDQKDDYLIAYGLLYNCDYLITGDGALLALKRLRGLTILDPSQFWSIVDRS